VQDDGNLEDAIRVVLIGERNNEDSVRKSGAVRAGLRRTFERGQPGGGPVADGYEVLRDLDDRGNLQRSWRLVPKRAEVVRLAFDLYEQGLGDPSIARELNRRGYRTKAGRPWERRRVQDALTNHLYAGRVVRDRGKPTEDVRPGSHPPLIDPERFDRLLVLRASRDRGGDKAPKKGAPSRNHALTGLARCGACGSVMRSITSSYRRKDGTRRRTYLCAHVKASTGLCDAPPVDAELADAAVINRLDGYLGDFEAWRAEIEAGRDGEIERIEGEVERAEAALKTSEAAVSAIAADYERRLVGGDQAGADEAMRLLTQKREETERAQVRLEATRDAFATEEAREVSADALLDFYNALAKAVSGRLDGADSMLRVNDALRDTFERFGLASTPHGVLVRPVLSAATAERISPTLSSALPIRRSNFSRRPSGSFRR
jgi:hypothetical protein